MKVNLVKATAMRSPTLPQLSAREECEALLCRQSLGHFVPAAWRHAGEPKGFQSNWHIDLLCDHLMAVARREIKGPGPLIFSMPPRHMKSRAISALAERAGMSKQAMNQLLRSLESLGYIARSDAPNEGRARIIRFTKRGRAVYSKIHDILRDIEREWSAELGPTRFAQLKELLWRVWNSPLIR